MVSKLCNASVMTLFVPIILTTNIPSTNCFNITDILMPYPEYVVFNYLLTKTGVASEINNQRQATVLVVNNSAAGSLSGQSLSVIRNVLASHVIVQYWDKTMFDGTSFEGNQKTIRVPDLLWKPSKSRGGQGFVSISKPNGKFVFGSAIKGGPQDSQMVKEVVSKPFDITVFEIRKPIVTPGLNLVVRDPGHKKRQSR